MFVATNRLRTVKGRGHELEERFGRRAGVEKQPGFLGFELWKKETHADHDEYLVVTHWDSKEAHHMWTRSEAFKEAHSGPRADFIVGHPEFSAYDVRLMSDSTGAKERVTSPGPNAAA